jgi:hypothetical protein
LEALKTIESNEEKFKGLFTKNLSNKNDDSWKEKSIRDIYLHMLPYVKFLDHVKEKGANLK